MDEAVTRRSVLGGGAALALLTACGGGSTDRTMAEDGSLLPLADLAVGESARVDVGDAKVVVTRTGESAVVAFDAACTHQGCPVKPADDQLTCNCHGSTFDARTGAVTNGPASAPLAAYPVKIAGGKVLKA